jgi:hypothetical protein
MNLIDRLREDSKGCPFPRIYTNCQEGAAALDEALAIARELARLACCMDALPRGSIGTQVALLEALERRVGVRA